MKRNRKLRLINQLLRTGLLCILLNACATVEITAPDIPSLKDQPEYTIESVDLLGMSTEMKQFVEAQVSKRGVNDSKAWLLAYAMLDQWVLDFTYDPQVTLTAREAFRVRRGNCLTFSNMFVAMAREAGLNAWYREVEIAPEWSSVDDTLLVSMHVNAAVYDRNTEYVVDVSRRRERIGERSRRLGDDEATAQFYNNLGANALVAEDLAMAYAYFRKALDARPNLAYVWSNMGVVLRRNGQTDDAMLAYQTALQYDPGQTVAINNLYTIYEEDGDVEAAARLVSRVERNRRRNPYYLHYLAEAANEEQLWDEGMENAEKAIRLEPNDYRFYYTLAQAQFHAGETRLAQFNLSRARRLAPPDISDEELTLPGDS